ncbi:hypothetical protein QQF64_022206 [Cirrhinus molitorella]|uniref:Uncharacterized protein n=1 Tax=Cirrhinus molitorella TaxID=172907 RepID=A0ABR3L7P2_9TELE
MKLVFKLSSTRQLRRNHHAVLKRNLKMRLNCCPAPELMTEQTTHASSYLQCLLEKMGLLEIEVSELKQLILSCPDEFTINNL